jgi:hypothetical protein
MGLAHSPSIVTDGLVLCLDAGNRKSISPLCCTGFNTAPQLMKNIVSPNDTIVDENGVRLGNVNYFTVFAIDYPESSYGGSAAGRNGITPGYNVVSGSKEFNFGRALNYAVWNKDSQTWVKKTTYDSYISSAAVDTFVSEYATAVATYPRAVHIVAGSHRDSYHTTAQYAILKDLGAPSNVDSIINISNPEWILVGEPGLGPNNAYGWVFQNYTTDSTRVAHLNLGLPIYGTKDNYLTFDGTDDRVLLPENSAFNTQTPTVEVWIKTNATSQNGFWFEKGQVNTQYSLFQEGGNIQWRQRFTDGLSNLTTTTANYINTNNWYQVVGTFSSGRRRLYINGVLVNSDSKSGTIQTNTNGVSIGVYGGYNGSRSYYYNGNLSNIKVYNKELSAEEVKQNFNATRGRFGL